MGLYNTGRPMKVAVKFIPPVLEVFRLLGMQSFNYNNRAPKVQLHITKLTPYLYHCENLNLSVAT